MDVLTYQKALKEIFRKYENVGYLRLKVLVRVVIIVVNIVVNDYMDTPFLQISSPGPGRVFV